MVEVRVQLEPGVVIEDVVSNLEREPQVLRKIAYRQQRLPGDTCDVCARFRRGDEQRAGLLTVHLQKVAGVEQ